MKMKCAIGGTLKDKAPPWFSSTRSAVAAPGCLRSTLDEVTIKNKRQLNDRKDHIRDHLTDNCPNDKTK